MADHWTGIVSAAVAEYVKGAEDRTLRKRLLMALLNARGLIKTGVDGSFERKYNVQYRKAPVTAFGYGDSASYQPRNYLKQATMQWKGYIATDEMHSIEYIQLRNSTHNLVNRYTNIVPNLISGLEDKLSESFYVDGSASGNENCFEGIETLCGTGGTVVAADLIVEPDDTYHNLDTDLHDAGTWSSDLTTSPNAAFGYDWPEGTGDPEFDYNSPLLVKWDGTGWGGTAATWEKQCIPCIRRTAQWMRQKGGLKGDTLLLMLSGNLMTGFKEAMDDRVRVISPYKEAEDLGFTDTLQFEGVGIKSEYGVAADTGYMVAVDNIKLDYITNGMIETNGPDAMDKDSMSYKFNALSSGNFQFDAKHTAKLYNFATT